MLKEKKLSDFNLNHIIYISVGSHFKETLNEIIDRKNGEIRDFKKSLWAFNSGISKTVFELCNKQYGEDEYAYCVMINTGKEIKTENGKEAKYYEGLNGEIIEIPEGMKVTFAQNGAYALMVEEYYKIIGDNVLCTKEYDYENYDKYIRGFGLLNKKDSDIKLQKGIKACLPKEVSYIAKLKKPFLVRIFSENPNDNK
ncbi:MAG: hypothetical protein RSA80_01565 [Lachnospiraceae bacterium]